MATLIWVCYGAFQLRTASIELKRAHHSTNVDDKFYPHPHPQYHFRDEPIPDPKHPNKGLRLRTIMVSNVPRALRNEKDLKAYFEYYLSRKLDKPSMGITSTTQPGFLNKSFAFLFNRAKRIPAYLPPLPLFRPMNKESPDGEQGVPDGSNSPAIECVVIARNMTEIASLLERREEVLRLLETAHIQLANNVLIAVKAAIDERASHKPIIYRETKAAEFARTKRSIATNPERGGSGEDTLSETARMDQLINMLGPFVTGFDVHTPFSLPSWKSFLPPYNCSSRTQGSEHSVHNGIQKRPQAYPPTNPSGIPASQYSTIWDALYALPRSSLDAYQPQINLRHIFHGKMVASIDYYTAKLNILSSLVTETRSKATSDYDPVSTAFVTFFDPADARQACKYLAVHPNNPLACVVTMAPMHQDLDWIRVMKSSFNTEVGRFQLASIHRIL